jgi:hypothetical protein
MEAMKLITDLFQEKGKWSRKNFAGAISLAFAYLYVSLGSWLFDYEPKQWVYDGALLFSATALGMTLIGKMGQFTDKQNTEQ